MPPTPRRTAVLMLLAVVLVAANLRAAISGFGPVLQEVRADTGLSATAAGVITSMPLACFAFVGSFSPWLARRVGVDRTIAASVVLLAVAQLLRVAAGVPLLMAGTLLACAGIAVVNVLLPVVVKDRFPGRIGPVTGAYTAALAGGSATAAAVSAPLAQLGGWRTSLGAWAGAAAVAAAVWVAAVRVTAPARAERAARVRRGHGAPAVPSRGIARHPVTWAVAVFFGTQATYAYIQMGWLPAVYADAGFSPAVAGALLAVSIVVGVPVSFAVPALAARGHDQRAWAVGLTLVAVVALLGLVVAPVAGAWVWAVLIGIGTGAFPLALTLFTLRTATVLDTVALSTLGQGIGYLIAVMGPFGFGLLRDSTGGWTVPLLALVGVQCVQAVAGYVAGRDVVVSRTRAPTPTPGRHPVRPGDR